MADGEWMNKQMTAFPIFTPISPGLELLWDPGDNLLGSILFIKPILFSLRSVPRIIHLSVLLVLSFPQRSDSS